MSVNRRRGEIEAVLDGQARRLVLTLGALAELEDAFGAEDIAQLVERFSTGRLASRDMIRILGCGLRAGGAPFSDEAAAALSHEDGVAGLARIVSELLSATFGAGT